MASATDLPTNNLKLSPPNVCVFAPLIMYYGCEKVRSSLVMKMDEMIICNVLTIQIQWQEQRLVYAHMKTVKHIKTKLRM